MRKVLTAVAAAALIGVTALASSSPAEAWGRWGWGWGPGPFWAASPPEPLSAELSPRRLTIIVRITRMAITDMDPATATDAGRYGTDMLGSVRASKHAIGTLVSKLPREG